MFRIAKNLVKTLEQSVQDTLALSSSTSEIDAFFHSIPPALLLPQMQEQSGYSPEDAGSASVRSNVNESLSGLRIVFVHETQLQLQSYFDFIVGINDEPVPVIINQHGYSYPDYNRIVELLNEKCNNYVKLNIWSGKGGNYRDEYVSVQYKDESQLEDVSLAAVEDNQAANKKFQSLGFKVQWSPLIAATFVYHILNINLPNGPAEQAGLIPDEDYIIGCQDGLLATGGETLLQDIVKSRANHELILYVYNKIHDCVRPITVNIGGDGRLGCNVGYGFLHRIPTVAPSHTTGTATTATTTAPPPAIEPPAIEPPAQLSEEAFTPQVALPTAGKKRTKTKHTTGLVDTDYFNEGKDTAPPSSTNSKADVPPPQQASRHNNKHTHAHLQYICIHIFIYII
ncbi:hypothetical protein TPHA_0E03780 [Tetrapisispora phaffii CBS 4417]|uniref:PDZ GRASP-type domain-containing protein n=1 Tax=Tetrapisispora phaffii (strain ATCC 24235 / CBS 4417 / NBRC 1672 / NRRL Y-8282 / UCD 70-5) TaxID=1071381 RepID=G8BU89_TETPH|nr:hypothetical protein TPHA_0E03780 [Tetrapisispora phaffii CBS 4417]CCE63467.1 hypothetical protein TPHA_0E03780 [Tetrapisispora phaffii CBS 4417]